MSKLDKKIGVPSLPSVNLIPQEIAEATKMRAVKVMALLAVLIALGVIVAGYVLALGAKQLAKSNLQEAIDEQTVAISERDSQKTVYDAVVDYEASAWTLGQIGFGDVAVNDVVYGLLATDSDSTSFSQVIFYGPTATGFGQRNAADTVVGGVGSIEFVASADSFEDASALGERIDAVPGLEQVTYVAESYTNGDGVVVYTVEGSVTVTEQALTLRFFDDDGFVVVDPDAALAEEDGNTVPEPSPTPSASEETE